MKNILVPIDYSDLSDYAFEFAAKIARHTGAGIRVIHILRSHRSESFDENDPEMSKGSGDVRDQKEYDVALQRLQSWLSGKDHSATGVLKQGKFYDAIIKEGKENCDLVIMGMHQHRDVGELLSKSVSNKVIHKSPLPVLTLKTDRSSLLLHRILFVSDFRDESDLDLNAIRDIQNSFGAEILMLKINTPKDKEPDDEVNARMLLFSEKCGLNVSSFHVYSANTVSEGVEEFADKNSIDLIVTGTHNRSDYSRLLKPSQAEDIVHEIVKPILTFRI